MSTTTHHTSRPGAGAKERTMHELSTLRLNLLRAMYLIIALGMGSQIWPLILGAKMPEHMRGVVWAMLGALTVLALLGLRYPVRMMPLLIFELAWKCVWVAGFGIPLWLAGSLDAGTGDTLVNCMFGVVLLPFVLPWPYIFATYLKTPGDPWRRPAVPRTSGVVSLES
ncbi:MAG TPA: hypothetical protein VGB92_23985 [Longimicrobium sp.]|jgi:hypothetical protein